MNFTFNSSEIELFETKDEDGEVVTIHIQLGSQARRAMLYVEQMSYEFYNGQDLVGKVKSMENIMRSMNDQLISMQIENTRQEERRRAALEHPAVAEAWENFEIVEALAQETQA